MFARTRDITTNCFWCWFRREAILPGSLYLVPQKGYPRSSREETLVTDFLEEGIVEWISQEEIVIQADSYKQTELSSYDESSRIMTRMDYMSRVGNTYSLVSRNVYSVRLFLHMSGW